MSAGVRRDLRAPLVFGYERYVLVPPRHERIARIHGVGGRGPVCPTLTQIHGHGASYPTLDREVVEYLFAMERAGDERHVKFCMNCVASDAHPLAVGA